MKTFEIGSRSIQPQAEIDPVSFSPILTFIDVGSGKKFQSVWHAEPRDMETFVENDFVLEQLTMELIEAKMI